MKKFLVINTSFFGDILLTGALCRNIKLAFPDSYIAFIANKPFVDAARYLDGVDEVLAYDKNGVHSGLKGAFRFYQQYKYNFSDGFSAAFVIYGNERGIILSRFFGAEKIYAENNSLIKLLLSNKKINYHGFSRVQERNSILLEQYTHVPVQNLPMLYDPPLDAYESARHMLESAGLTSNDKFICLCTVSKKVEKDMPISTCAELIDRFHGTDYRMLLLGAGGRATEYSQQLKKCTVDYIDMINKTSIPQLAAVLKLSAGLISVDTGTMHLGLAVNTPVTALFYINDAGHIAKWGPDQNIYKAAVLKSEQCSSNEIFNSALKIIEK